MSSQPELGSANETVLANHRTATGATVTVSVGSPESAAYRTYAVAPTSTPLVGPLDVCVAAAAVAAFASAGADASLASWPALLCLAGAQLHAARRWRSLTAVAEASVTAVRGLGLQLSQRRRVTGTTTRHIDQALIEALVIHEGFYRHQVVFYIAVVTRGSSEVTVLFDTCLPRLDALRPVLRGLRRVLYDEPEAGLSLAQRRPDGDEGEQPAAVDGAPTC
jgi:hypothetical protein